MNRHNQSEDSPSLALVTLVVGSTAHKREAAIWATIANNPRSNRQLSDDAQPQVGLILEGLPDGKSDNISPQLSDTSFRIQRIAPGCLCCTGNLVLRVTLNRLLREHLQQIYISIADASHLDNLRLFLSQPPYDAFLRLEADLVA
ncbi:GTPase [Glaciimonas soli]|uniref:GTPase n=1 Tax=Glaciimonas soli TaxID=2590999 RepID=A0A843YSB3_9BURK|nr:GTPase [Glaciimonas soli]MQR00398.1 GTPase [Glaciimonas soli]